MKPTIRSLAAAAGVSRGTVDRVLNHRPGVKPAVRARVLRVAEEAGYRTDETPDSAVIRIGVIVPHWENSYFTDRTRRGIERATRLVSAHETVLYTEEMHARSTEEYIRCCETLLAQNVQGLVLNAPDNVLMRAEIDRLTAAGVRIVTYNSDLPHSGRLCHVGQDLLRSGRIAAGLLAGRVAEGDHLLVVTGNMEFLSHRLRLDGCCERLGELGWSSDRYEIIACYEQRELTGELVAAALRRDRRIGGIYMGSESVQGCLDGITAARVRRPIHIVSNDMTPFNRRALRAGKLDFVVEQEFSAQVFEAILTLHDHLAHGQPIREPIRYVRTSVVTREML